jgi:hypothetical protein
VQFTFARYPVAHHLENAWIVETHAVADQVGAEAGENDRADGAPDFRRWYIAVAQGGSLYMEATRRYMSKLETHHFVNAHSDVSSTQRAFWYAFARAQTSDITIALRVARTKLAAFPVVSTFWQHAARFFARNPTSVLEMNDMIDFLQGAKREDERFSLKGRTLPALRWRMEEWHRALRDIKCGRRWNRDELPDVDYETGSDCERAIWRFRQIKTGDDLCREGQRMHHCVATYKDLCVTGALSIWSLTCECPIGTIRTGATIELDREGAIVQCRGFGNRLPTAEEAAVVKRWAEESGLTWASVEQ